MYLKNLYSIKSKFYIFLVRLIANYDLFSVFNIKFRLKPDNKYSFIYKISLQKVKGKSI